MSASPLGVLLLLSWLAIYLVPTIVAAVRGVPNYRSVVLINVFLGWTAIGWAYALFMAVKTAPARTA